VGPTRGVSPGVTLGRGVSPGVGGIGSGMASAAQFKVGFAVLDDTKQH
jgi:hypothetical protein